jgi:hypothetical protein
VPGTGLPRWLLLFHHLPPRPAYLRVKVGRRLQGLGAVALKNSVYVLPRGDQAREDFQWLRREIVSGGGEATVCEAGLVEGHSDADVEALFVRAREADYAALAGEARRLERVLAGARTHVPAGSDQDRQALARLRRRLAEVARIDFFGAPGRNAAEGRLAGIEARLRPRAPQPARRPPGFAGPHQGCTWVTRSGVRVDRIASAWLIRRFIDPKARFKFVPGHAYAPRKGELRFDMFEGEFTHDGDLCTFEVLLREFARREAALRSLGEIVHDIDVKDGKFARPEAAGLERLLAGLCLRHPGDQARLAEGAGLFESLYESFKRKR